MGEKMTKDKSKSIGRLLFGLGIFLIIIAGCRNTEIFIEPGFYEAGCPQEDAVYEFLNRSSVTVTLSGHAGISMPNEKGWDNNISIKQLKARLEKIADKRQITILEEKNYTGQNQLDKKVVSLLKKLDFKIIIIQVAHSGGTIIEQIIKNNS